MGTGQERLVMFRLIGRRKVSGGLYFGGFGASVDEMLWLDANGSIGMLNWGSWIFDKSSSASRDSSWSFQE